MTSTAKDPINLAALRRMKAHGRKFSMLTAYDYPTAASAQSAGVHSLLIGDSLGNVVLGHENTRRVPLDLMIILADAVRRGAPNVYFVGDVPFECMAGGAESVLAAAVRFRDEAGCDAVKFEAASQHTDIVARLAGEGFEVIAHLGLRPQSVVSPDGYRAQARDAHAIECLVRDGRNMVDAGAAMLLLEAVPNEASQAVVEAVDVPVIGCGAGPACDGHVVVTHDLLGIGRGRTPRFVPILARISDETEAAMRDYVAAIDEQRYPADEHVYKMKRVANESVANR